MLSVYFYQVCNNCKEVLKEYYFITLWVLQRTLSSSSLLTFLNGKKEWILFFFYLSFFSTLQSAFVPFGKNATQSLRLLSLQRKLHWLLKYSDTFFYILSGFRSERFFKRTFFNTELILNEFVKSAFSYAITIFFKKVFILRRLRVTTPGWVIMESVKIMRL